MLSALKRFLTAATAGNSLRGSSDAERIERLSGTVVLGILAALVALVFFADY